MMINFNGKKGALNLSINAIVVLIIAIVFLGLALTFTRNIINQSTDKLVTGINNVDLSTPADANNPITVDSAFEVKKNGKKTMKIGFYNRGSTTQYNAAPVINSCVLQNGSPTTNIPKIGAIPVDVSANDETRFQVTFSAGTLEVSSYICNLNIGAEDLQVAVDVKS